MLEFLSNNWVWILLIGGMLVLHLGHGGGSGGHGGCCSGHEHSGHQHGETEEPSRKDPVAAPNTTITEAPDATHGSARRRPR